MLQLLWVVLSGEKVRMGLDFVEGGWVDLDLLFKLDSSRVRAVQLTPRSMVAWRGH